MKILEHALRVQYSYVPVLTMQTNIGVDRKHSLHVRDHSNQESSATVPSKEIPGKTNKSAAREFGPGGG